MKFRLLALASVVIAPLMIDACTSYGYGPPPPPGYRGEGWRRHVRRCERAYPNYDPRTDLIERRSGAAPCPL